MKEIMAQYGSVLIATVVCIGVLGLLCQVPFAERKRPFFWSWCIYRKTDGSCRKRKFSV